MADLQVIGGKTPAGRHQWPNIPGWSQIVTPMSVSEWERQLTSHPDKLYRTYIVEGLKQGFRIGFSHESARCVSAVSNMSSASERPSVIDEFIATELAAGRVLGPIDSAHAIHINRFGLVPKGHGSGKWRLIVDLSFPAGSSVNDGISPELCSLQYTSVDSACQRVVELGQGAYLAKFDVSGAFRTVPVHPDDRHLLGMKWRGLTYVDKVLPFGLRSAPKLYNAVADGLLWILVNNDQVMGIHYLDDFLLFGAPGSSWCAESLSRALARCSRLGVPIAPAKTEGPTTKLVFLGIELDSVSLTISLPQEKLDRLRAMIQEWVSKRSCTKRELLSLIGYLQHACRVIRPGRSFLRRMIDLSTGVRALHHRVRLNASFRSDLKWWHCFLPIWNGTCPMSSVTRREPQVVLTSDASGSWGYGAYTSTGLWFQLKFPDSWSELHITVKELLPIVLAVALWGHHWKGASVACRCDNMAVVAIVNSGRSRMDRAMHLMRCLSFFMARWDVTAVCQHIPGIDNGAGDALSRNSLPLFQQLVPEAAADATPIPESLLQRHPGLDQSGLGDPVQKYYMMGLAESMHKLYACGARRFVGICSAARRAPVPADEDTLCHFAATLAAEGLRHISEGHGDPFSAGLHRLHYVLRGVKRAEGMAGVTKRERRPITPDILRKIKGVWDPRANEADVAMLWAACCLAYFGFMRIGELTVPADNDYDASSHLSWGDVMVDDPAAPSRIEVHLKTSKD